MFLTEQVLDAVGDGLVNWDLRSGRAQYSARWKALLGYEPFELEDSHALWLELSHPDDRAEADQRFIEQIEGSWPMVHTWRFRHKDGTWRWLRVRGVTRISETTGDPERVLMVFSDISDRVIAERRLEALVAAVPDLLVRVTKEGTILDVKLPPGAGETRQPPALGSSFSKWAADEGLADGLLPLVQRVRSAGKSETAEIGSSSPPRRSYEAHVVLASEDEVICILRDVTSRRNLEAQIHQTQRLESIGQLAAGIAHEINTPVQFVSDSLHFLRSAFTDVLTVVNSYRRVRDCAPALPVPAELEEALGETRTLEAELDVAYLEENMGPALDRAVEGLERIATIVRSIKEFAHPATGEKVMTDLNRAVTTTLTMARSEYKYVAEVESKLGDLPLVPCLPGEINQALLNLIVNASHAIADRMKGTDAKGQISIHTRVVDQHAEIAIADTGGGIPESIQHRIFDPFFTTKEVGRGTGQGLSISRSTIVDKHQGTLTFETEVGRGTTFYIRLPLDGAAPASALASGATG